MQKFLSLNTEVLNMFNQLVDRLNKRDLEELEKYENYILSKLKAKEEEIPDFLPGETIEERDSRMVDLLFAGKISQCTLYGGSYYVDPEEVYDAMLDYYAWENSQANIL